MTYAIGCTPAWLANSAKCHEILQAKFTVPDSLSLALWWLPWTDKDEVSRAAAAAIKQAGFHSDKSLCSVSLVSTVSNPITSARKPDALPTDYPMTQLGKKQSDTSVQHRYKHRHKRR